MNTKTGQQPDTLEKIRLDIASSEERRRTLRFEHNLSALALGSIQVLGNDEFVSGLVAYLPENFSNKKDLNRKILIALGDAVVCEETRIRERTLAVLSLVAVQYLQHNDKGSIILLVRSFSRWLEYETEVLPGLTIIVKCIEDLSIWLLEMSFWKDAEKIITLLATIRSGELEKCAAIRSLAAKTLSRLATESLTERLTDSYLLKENDQELQGKILLCFGKQSAVYLTGRAGRSSDHTERLALMELLPTFREHLFPVLEEYLKEDHQWAALRNIIFIVSELGEESLYPLLRQFFSHEDRRVQHEMIRCVIKLGGATMNARLIAGLGAVNDSLKIYIIRMLAEHEKRDESAVSAFGELLDKRRDFPSNSTHEIQNAIITALRAFPCRQSIALLNRLQTEYRKIQESEHVLLQIDHSLKILTPQVRHNRQRPEDLNETVSFDSDPLQKQLAFNKIAKTEEEVRRLIAQGDSKKAGILLYEHALVAGKERDFATAEMLRDRMLEVNPMALGEVIELGEWIEEQKTTAIGSHRIEIWSNLYEEMSTEEFDALYRAMRQEDYRKGDPIVQAGESDESLYFLNSGYISLNCISGGRENFLKRMGPSDVLGSEQFFSASVWTVSLRALSDVQVHVLDHDAFKAIACNFPEFEGKLIRYCDKIAKIPELLKMSGDDRREYPRYPVTFLTRNHLRDPYGAKGSRDFNGELVDISRNGLAFEIKISSRKNARLLLGRQIVSEIQVEGKPPVQCSGIIVGVRFQDRNDQNFTVHVKLFKKIDDTAFKNILSLGQQG